jgi:hypothetical protein
MSKTCSKAMFHTGALLFYFSCVYHLLQGKTTPFITPDAMRGCEQLKLMEQWFRPVGGSPHHQSPVGCWWLWATLPPSRQPIIIIPLWNNNIVLRSQRNAHLKTCSCIDCWSRCRNIRRCPSLIKIQF